MYTLIGYHPTLKKTITDYEYRNLLISDRRKYQQQH